MSSIVDVCNAALAHLGDSATVASIDPPEGSPQAEHCARFYPMSASAMLEMHTWNFCTRRAALAELANPSSTWLHAYAKPSGAIQILSILDPAATDDYSATAVSPSAVYSSAAGGTIPTMGAYTPQNFVIETNSQGDEIILTNQADAVCRFTVTVSDSTKFPALFTEALSWLLASKLSGPVVKGQEGIKAGQACMQTFVYWLNQAKAADASSTSVTPQQQVTWMNGR